MVLFICPYFVGGRMLGSNPGLLRLWHGQPDALTLILDPRVRMPWILQRGIMILLLALLLQLCPSVQATHPHLCLIKNIFKGTIALDSYWTIASKRIYRFGLQDCLDLVTSYSEHLAYYRVA